MQVALLGAPGTDLEQFCVLLGRAQKATGHAAEIAIADPNNGLFNGLLEADLIFLIGLQSTRADDVDADRLLREMLARKKRSYQVLYGALQERLAQALDVIRRGILDVPASQASPKSRPDKRATSSAQWVWACDKCSDPQCEHRLLTGLLANRAASALTGQLP